MKKDIRIPVSKHLQLWAVPGFHDELGENVWTLYVFNSSEMDLETVLIISRGGDKDIRTSILRRNIPFLKARQFAKLEILTKELQGVRTELLITYFAGSSLCETTIRIEAENLQEDLTEPLPGTAWKGLVFS